MKEGWRRLRYRLAWRRFRTALDALQRVLFAFYLREWHSSVRLIPAHVRLFRAVQRYRRDGSPAQSLLLERLYESVFLLGQLRFRVNDRTQFDVCRDEMHDLMHGLMHALIHDPGRSGIAACFPPAHCGK